MTRPIPTTTDTTCLCGGFGCTAPGRVARGLLPFCRMVTPTSAPAPDLSTMEMARAHFGEGVPLVGVRTGMGHGPVAYVPPRSYRWARVSARGAA